MRLTVNLNPDVYAFAKAYAGGKGLSLSAAINELVRRAEKTPEPEPYPPRLEMDANGYLVIAATGNVLTPEMVKDASEDELIDLV